MNKLLLFVKNNFLTRKFLSFGVIGVINTLIHMSVYYVFFHFVVPDGAFLSNTAAFISASTFSYFANAAFTFKPTQKTTTQFTMVMLVFLVRLLISDLLTILFNYILEDVMLVDYAAHHLLSIVPPFLASVLLIPIAYFVLDVVFKRTDVKKL